MARVYVGHIGLKIEITVTNLNLTGMTVVYDIKRPDGTTFTKTATINTAASGITSYTTIIATDFDQAGEYLVQPKITSGADVFLAETVSVMIYDKFK